MSLSYKKLGDVCEILDSKRIPITASERKPGPYPYYGANGVQDYVADFIFDDDLILLAEDGGNFGSKDRPIAYRVSGKIWVNNHAHVLKPLPGIDVDYLCYSLMFYDTSNLINGATRQKLTQAAMRQMVIPLRSWNEQKAISQKISTVADLIALRQSQLKALDRLASSRFIEMFGDPIENPKEWETYSLSDFGQYKNGMNFRNGESGFQVHCLGVGDFQDHAYIRDAGILPLIDLNSPPDEAYLLQDEDIVFVRSNGNKALVGRCVVVYPGTTDTVYSGFCIRFRQTTKLMSTAYLLMVLKSSSMRKAMAGRGANIQNLNQQTLNALKIPAPPMELQNEFAAFIEQLDKSKVAGERQRILLEKIACGGILQRKSSDHE